jgi:hypothetical protein
MSLRNETVSIAFSNASPNAGLIQDEAPGGGYRFEIVKLEERIAPARLASSYAPVVGPGGGPQLPTGVSNLEIVGYSAQIFTSKFEWGSL